jgi:hypothetical protein
VTPSIGRIVHYQLSQDDAIVVTNRRLQTGVVGNHVAAGQTYPAMVVRTFGGTTVNLRVVLDGDDLLWATSRVEGTEAGTWCWPPRV